MGTMDIWHAHLDEDELMSSIRAFLAGTAKQDTAAKKAEQEAAISTGASYAR